MTLDATNTSFVLSSSLRGTGAASRRRVEAIRDALRLRYTVVRVNNDGSLPLRAEVSAFNSADALDEARDLLTRLDWYNPGSTFVIVDRVERVAV